MSFRRTWRQTYKLIDRTGVTHMGLIHHNDNLDDDESFIACIGAWVSNSSFEKTENYVTCVVCAMFRVDDGSIKLWAPS